MAKVIFILALAVGMFASACFGAAAYNNLITDGDMEAAGTGAYGCTNATLSKDSGVKYSGAQSLRISNTVPYFGSHFFPKSIAVPTNAVFHSYVRAPSTATLNTNTTLVTLGQWKYSAPAFAYSKNGWVQSTYDGYIYTCTAIWMYIYKTLNGVTWTQIANNNNFGGYGGSLDHMIQTANGDFFTIVGSYAIGSNTGGVWKCTDGTVTNWTKIANTFPDFVVNNRTNWVTRLLETSNGDLLTWQKDLFKSTNHGTNWTVTGYNDTDFSNMSSIGRCIELSNGNLLVGGGWEASAAIWKSTSGGTGTWSKVAKGSDYGCNGFPSLIQASDGAVYVGGSSYYNRYPGNVLKSTDNGDNWTRVADGTAGDFGRPYKKTYSYPFLMELANGDIFVGLTGKGRYYKSSDGGTTWVEAVNLDDVDGQEIQQYLFQASNGDIYGSDYNWPVYKTIGVSVGQAGITNDNNWYEIETVVRKGDFLFLGAGSLTQGDYLNYDELMLLTSLIENGGMERETEIVHAGTAQGSTTNNTIILAVAASDVDDYYKGMRIRATNDILAGWADNRRTITNYVGATRVAMVNVDWANVNPTNGSGYEVYYYDYFNGVVPFWRMTGSLACTNSDDEHTGIYAQQVGAGDASANYVGQTVAVEQGKCYTFGGWLKRVSGDGNVNISISGAATKNLSSTNSIYNKVSHTFAARSTSLDIRLYADLGTVGLIDDVSFVRAPPMGGTVLSIR